MAPHPNPPEDTAVPSSTLSSQMPQESQTGLPGLKRGIAIGVAACVAIILIALLAFFAIRRRKRLSSKKSQSDVEVVEAPNDQSWTQEKYRRLSPPPVEADARTIYEMDANQTPELPGYTETPEKDADERNKDFNTASDELEESAQDFPREQPCTITSDTQIPPVLHHADRQLPLLTISPSEVQPGDVSPLVRFSWEASSPSPSTGSVSPLAEVHLPNRRFGNV